MTNEFQGYVREFEDPQERELPRSKEPNRESQRLPQQYYPESQPQINLPQFFSIIFLIIGIVSLITMGWFFLEQIKDGKLKTDITQTIKPEFYENTTNNFEFTPSTSNSYYTQLNNSFTFNFNFGSMNFTIRTNSS